MFWSKLTAAITLLALAPSALAVGSAIVVNNCGKPVYMASVSQGVSSSMQPMAGGYSQAFSNPGDGVSIKMSPTASGAVTQFEFTLSSDGSVAYDISNINGNPFAEQGMSLTPSMAGASGYPTCATVNCPAGQSSCSAAYNAPDDTRTMVCPENTNLVFTLCTGGTLKRDTIFETISETISQRMHPRQFKW